MARYKPKAVKNFEEKFAEALAVHDWPCVERLLLRYGYYLELEDPLEGMGDAEEFLIEWTTEKYDPTVTLPDWEPPKFLRESKVFLWRNQLEIDFMNKEIEQWSAVKFHGHPAYEPMPF